MASKKSSKTEEVKVVAVPLETLVTLERLLTKLADAWRFGNNAAWPMPGDPFEHIQQLRNLIHKEKPNGVESPASMPPVAAPALSQSGDPAGPQAGEVTSGHSLATEGAGEAAGGNSPGSGAGQAGP